MNFLNIEIIPVLGSTEQSHYLIDQKLPRYADSFTEGSELRALFLEVSERLAQNDILKMLANARLGPRNTKRKRRQWRDYLEVKHFIFRDGSTNRAVSSDFFDIPLVRDATKLLILMLYHEAKMRGGLFERKKGYMYAGVFDCVMCGHEHHGSDWPRACGREPQYSQSAYCRNKGCISHELECAIDPSYTMEGKEFDLGETLESAYAKGRAELGMTVNNARED